VRRYEHVLFFAAVAAAAVTLGVAGHWSALLLLVTLAALYARLPAGARAALAAVTGAFVVFGGVLALLELRWDGATVRDVAQLALLPLGVASLGAGVLALLSRRRTTWPRRIVRWTLTLGVAALLALQVIVPGVAAMRRGTSRRETAQRSSSCTVAAARATASSAMQRC